MKTILPIALLTLAILAGLGTAVYAQRCQYVSCTTIGNTTQCFCY